MTPSALYDKALQLAKEQHKKSKNYNGKFLRPHRKRIKEIVDRLGCESALDYGCGRGTQYTWVSESKSDGRTLEQYWGITVTKYDPAYAPFAAEPEGSFDLVICTHVLGLIPVPDLEWVVDRIFGFANKAVYIVLNTGATQKRSKSRYRIDELPLDWGAEEWLDLLRRRRKPGVELQFIARPTDPTKTSGHFIIDDAGLRGPL